MHLTRLLSWGSTCLVLLAGSPAFGATLSTADLPAAGETLEISEDSSLRIPADGTAELGGTISVTGSGTRFDLIVDGELHTGDGATLVINSGEIDLSGQGLIQGSALAVTNSQGRLNWQIEGQVTLDRLSIESLESEVTISNRGRWMLGDLSIANKFNGPGVTIENEGVFSVSGQASIDDSGNNESGTRFLLHRSTTIASMYLHVPNGNFELSNFGQLSVEQLTSVSSGWGLIAIINSGFGWFGQISTGTYGAHLDLQNLGALEIQSWMVKDQNDASVLLTAGAFRIGTMSLTSNGAFGSIEWTNLGTVQVDHLAVDANYGGKIEIDAVAGGLNVRSLNCDASGASQGQTSQISMRLGRGFFAGRTVMNAEVEVLDLAPGEVFQTTDGQVRLEAMEQTSIGSGAPLVYPQLALGGGYEVVLILTNKSSDPWSGTVALLQGDHSDWATDWSLQGADAQASHFQAVLPADGSRKYVLRGDASARPGFLVITADEGLSTSAVSTSFFYNFMDASALVDSTGVPPAPGGTAFAFPVEKTALVNTGLAWAAGDDGLDFDVRVSLYDSEGEFVAETTIAFQGHLARFFAGSDGLFPGVSDGFIGKVVIHSDEVIHVTVLRLELTDDGFQLTSVPPDDFVP